MSNINIKKQLIPFIFMILVLGCKKDLNYAPESYLSPEQVYSDEAGSVGGVTGIYRNLQRLKRSELSLIGNIGTDEGKTSAFVPGWGGYWLQLSALSSYDNIQLSPQSDPVYYYWKGVYNLIANANNAIRYLKKGTINENLKNRLLGESMFLRAVGYYYLVQLFGSVPMPTDVVNADYDSYGYPKSSVDDIYKLIVSDLSFAAENLNNKSATEKGRASKQAAQALLGKVYLTLKDYAKAKATLEPLMNTPETRLLDNFGDLFKEENENNIESLLEIQYSTESGYTQNVSEILGSWNISSNQPGGGGQVAVPTPYAYNLYSDDDSYRKNATLRSVYYDGNGNPGYNDWWRDVGKPHIKKYEQKAGQASNSSSRNLYYLRYADVILMYAEALNELNQTSEAVTYFNKIRARAKAAPLSVSTKADFKDSLVVERAKELMFEGWRWFDLKRWGLLISRAKAYNPDASNIQEPKHLLYPIPYREFSVNTNLKSTDQNPGY
jgi:tetratricopeptide (TPR) repeat protein